MRCPRCGEETLARGKFCDRCGAMIESGAGDGGQPRGKADTIVPGKPAAENSTVTIQSFGRYRVMREVGRGAMGVVYLARDDRIARNVAIKALHVDERLPESEREEIRGRFNREAQAAGMLSHPNIVTVHDVGEESSGTPYIAMEYLEGATLTEVAGEGPLSIPQATAIITQVLSALSYAHGHDVVHRDIKPDNIFLLPDGRVKVADFGIARIASSATMTRVGQVMGTPGYMSPEQVRGEAVGPPSDIFSTGVLLYELLTGTPAFASTSPTSVMYKIVHEEPKAPHLINPGVPDNLEAVIAKATSKSPSARYTSAREMRQDIETGASPVTAPAPAAPEGTVLRAAPLAEAMPPAAVIPAPAPSPQKKKTGLVVGIAAGVFLLVVAALVVAIVLVLTGGRVSIKSVKTKPSGSGLKVALDITNPKKVGKVEFSIDNENRGVVQSPPFDEAEVDTTGFTGNRTLGVFAYDSSGVLLAQKEIDIDIPGPGEESGKGGSKDINPYVSGVTASSWTVDRANGLAYPPEQARDNNETTCWAADLRSDPNPSISFTFAEPMVVTGVHALPGYKKFSDVDRYLQNAKPRTVRLTFDGQSSQDVTFDLAPSYAALAWQDKPLGAPVTTRNVKVTVLDTYPGQSMGGGHTASRDVSTSELHLLGHAASGK